MMHFTVETNSICGHSKSIISSHQCISPKLFNSDSKHRDKINYDQREVRKPVANVWQINNFDVWLFASVWLFNKWLQIKLAMYLNFSFNLMLYLKHGIYIFTSSSFMIFRGQIMNIIKCESISRKHCIKETTESHSGATAGTKWFRVLTTGCLLEPQEKGKANATSQTASYSEGFA